MQISSAVISLGIYLDGVLFSFHRDSESFEFLYTIFIRFLVW